MKTLAISIHDPNNIGDQVCCPADYFGIPDVVKVDAWDFGSWMYDTESHMIFGGGGLIHGILAQVIRHVQRNPNRKLIAWGLGHNQHGQTTNDYGGTLDGFDLIGVRDFKRAALQGWDYVPCASCMSPWFGFRVEDWKYKYFTYAHHENPVVLKSALFPVPAMLNDSPCFRYVLQHLSSGETIITNSYHGAYWSMLLNRGVKIYKPFSSRFHDFPIGIQPKFCDESNWRDVLALHAGEGFLEHCRDLNRKFYEKVKTTLGIHAAGTAGRSGDSRDIGVDAVPVSESGAAPVEAHPEKDRVVP